MANSLTLGGPLNQPLYRGSAGSVSQGLVPNLWSLSIAGHVYKVDWAKYRRTTTPVLTNASDTSAVPNETSLSREGRWTRYGISFHHGAGQKRFDADTRAIIEGRTDDRYQFSTSKGLNIWTEGQATLHHDTGNRFNTTGTNYRLLPTAAGLYAVNGTSLVFNATPTTSGTWVGVTGTPGTAINDITTDGTTIYLATASGMYSGAIGGASVAIMASLSSPYQVAQVVNGRLIAGKANVLMEIAANGSEAAVAGATIRNTSFQWTAIWAGPTRFYAAGGTTSFSEVYQVGVSDAGALISARLATPIPPGELVRAGMIHVGTCVLATSKGIRFAEIQSDGGLLYGPLISAPGDCRCLAAEDRFVWFGWTNYDSGSTGVGRAGLDVTTGPLVPVYASDLMHSSQGIVLAVARLGGLTYFAVSGVGVIGEQPTFYVPSATLDSGWVSYGTVETKTYVSVDLRHSVLAGGAVSVAYVDDSEVAVPFGTSGVAGTTRPEVPISMGQIRAERLRVQVTLTRDSLTATPTLFRWKLLAHPVPQRSERIEASLIFAEKVLVGTAEGQIAPFDPYTEYQFLLGLAASGQIVQVQTGIYTDLVRVEAVQLTADKTTQGRDWVQGECAISMLTA